MADARELRYGIDFDTGKAGGTIDDLEGRVDNLERRLGAVEMGAQRMGAEAVSACDAGAESAGAFADRASELSDSLDDTSDSAQTAADTTRQFGQGLFEAGSEADALRNRLRETAEGAADLGEAFRDTMAAGLQAGQSIAKSFQTGITGAIDFSTKKAKTWAKDMVKHVKDINTQFQHPIKTIREKLMAALQDAKGSTEEAGDAANEAAGEFGAMGDEGERAGNDISDALKGAAKALISFQAIKKGIELMKEFGQAAVSAFKDAETTGKKFNAIFSPEVGTWAKNYADATHRSTTEVKQFLIQNKLMYQELGITGEAAEFLSEMTTSLAYDFGNAFSMSDADALAAIQEAISGNTDALAEFGINLDEAALKQSAQAMGLDDNIAAMDDATRAQVILNSILQQSEDIQRAAVEQTDGLTNATKNLTGEVDNFLTGAGAQFAPMLEDIVDAVVGQWPLIESTGTSVIDALVGGFDGFGETLGGFISDTLPSLGAAFTPVAEAVGPLAEVILNLTGTVLPPLAEIFGSLASAALPPLIDVLNTLTNDVLAPLMPVIESVASSALPPLSEAFSAAAEVIGNLATAVMPPLAEIFGTVVEAMSPVFDALTSAAQSIFPALNPLVQALGDLLSGVVAPAFEAISPILTTVSDALGTVIGWISDLIGWFAEGAGKIISFFTNLFGGAEDSEAEVAELTSTIENLQNTDLEDKSLAVDTSQYTADVEAAAATTQSTVSEATTAAQEAASSSFDTMSSDADTAFTSVSDASTQAQELTSDSFATMLSDAQAAYTSIEQASSDAATAVGADFDSVESAAQSAYTAAASAAESSWSRMVTSASNGATSIVESFRRIEQAARNASSASLSVSAAGIPGHAEGTPSFEGGWTRMNEEGGELAFLPQGTAIIPADKTDEIINNSTSNTNSSYTDSSSFAPQISITLGGGGDPAQADDMEVRLRALLEQFWREKKEEDYRNRAMQGAFARL